MNENIDLTKILKDCPKGTKLYSTIFGEVEFIECGNLYQIIVAKENKYYYFTLQGKFIFERIPYNRGECCLFPSKEIHDWSKFTAPWYKKKKFDSKTLQPFDRVLVKLSNEDVWTADFFSHYDPLEEYMKYVCVANLAVFCIPYNDETNHLVGTTEGAPEYYRYLEELDIEDYTYLALEDEPVEVFLNLED